MFVLIFMRKLWLMIIGLDFGWLMFVGMIVWLCVILLCMNFGVILVSVFVLKVVVLNVWLGCWWFIIVVSFVLFGLFDFRFLMYLVWCWFLWIVMYFIFGVMMFWCV